MPVTFRKWTADPETDENQQEQMKQKAFLSQNGFASRANSFYN